jgi:hypothetical protein
METKIIINFFFCESGLLAAMSGGNLGRSRSLVDVRDLHGSDGGASGTGLRGGLSFFSEEEGLALLSQNSPAEQAQSMDNFASTFDQDKGLLDYESDRQDIGQEKAIDVILPDPRNDGLPASTAMDVENLGSPQASDSVPIVMDSVYYQCRSARTMCQKDTLVSVSVDESFGKQVIVQSPNIGSFEDQDDIVNTFRGSRIMKGNEVVNKSISASFDPAKLVCISCDIEHAIVGKKPSCYLFSDQNFVSSISSPLQDCVNVVRIENATLVELFDTAKEILGNAPLAEGSIFMYGSVSHLSRVGTSAYAKEWTDITARTAESWHVIRICPLIPLIRSECVGSVVRELSELTLWLEKVYDSDPQGLQEVWRGLVSAMDSCSTGTALLDVMESYKVLVPSSLQCRTLDMPLTFCSSSSRPVTFLGLPKDRCDELLGSLLNTVFSNFRACPRPEEFLARAAENTKKSETSEQKVILVRASNLFHASRHFDDPELIFENLSVPGWTPLEENVRKMMDIVKDKAKGNVALVFDLLGNSSVCFEQFDGTTALPFKSNGGFHLGGKVTSTPLGIFKKVIELVLPILKAKGEKPCVIVPPLPRYLFSRCCSDKGHCTNAGDKDFSENLLSGFILLRNELIRCLVQNGLTNFKVLDVCCATTCTTTSNLTERLTALRGVLAEDGVHFTPPGYNNLAKRTVSCLKTLLTEKPKVTKKHTFFWRGYRSPHGSLANNPVRSVRGWVGSSTSNTVRGNSYGRSRVSQSGRFTRSRFFHPYKRW